MQQQQRKSTFEVHTALNVKPLNQLKSVNSKCKFIFSKKIELKKCMCNANKMLFLSIRYTVTTTACIQRRNRKHMIKRRLMAKTNN